MFGVWTGPKALISGKTGSFPCSRKMVKVRLEWSNGPFRFGPNGIFGTTFEGAPLWRVWSFWSLGPKLLSPEYRSLVPYYKKNNNQTRGGLGRVCATGIYRSISHMAAGAPWQPSLFASLNIAACWESPTAVEIESISKHRDPSQGKSLVWNSDKNAEIIYKEVQSQLSAILQNVAHKLTLAKVNRE